MKLGNFLINQKKFNQTSLEISLIVKTYITSYVGLGSVINVSCNAYVYLWRSKEYRNSFAKVNKIQIWKKINPLFDKIDKNTAFQMLHFEKGQVISTTSVKEFQSSKKISSFF